MLPDYELFSIDSIFNIFEDWSQLKIPSKTITKPILKVWDRAEDLQKIKKILPVQNCCKKIFLGI